MVSRCFPGSYNVKLYISSGNNQSVGSSAPVVSRCFPGSYNVKLYISRGRLAWWLLAFLCCVGFVGCDGERSRITVFVHKPSDLMTRHSRTLHKATDIVYRTNFNYSRITKSRQYDTRPVLPYCPIMVG